MELIVGITGASGSILGLRLLEVLKDYPDVKTHLIISKWAKRIMEIEGVSYERVKELADYNYRNDDLAAPISSGSYPIDGMIIIPCSMATLAAIANGYSNTLIARSAAISLKEGRKLILVVRETPLNQIHIKNMEEASRAGATILPPVLTFYHKPRSIDDLILYIIGKILDLLGIKHNLYPRWLGGGKGLEPIEL